MVWLLLAGIAAAWILLFGTSGEAATTVSSNVPNSVSQWTALAQQYAQTYSILDPEEILAVIWTESSGNANGQNPNDPSWGLMGVTALIAHAYGGFAPSDISWHTDPDGNVRSGAGFLADLKSKYSAQYPGWVAGYNEGEGNLLKGYADQAYVDRFNRNLAALKGNL